MVFTSTWVNEGDDIQHIYEEPLERVAQENVLKSEQNTTNKNNASNTRVIPRVVYSFYMINCKLNHIKILKTKTRKKLTIVRLHHPKANVNIMYLPRISTRQGLIQPEILKWSTSIHIKTTDSLHQERRFFQTGSWCSRNTNSRK